MTKLQVLVLYVLYLSVGVIHNIHALSIQEWRAKFSMNWCTGSRAGSEGRSSMATALLTAALVALPSGLVSPDAAKALDQPPYPIYGLKDGRLLKCRQKSNCISTSSINSVDKYSAPWEFKKDPVEEFDDIVKAIKSTAYLDLVEENRDKLYLRAEAKSAFPPTGIDDLEILLNSKDKLIAYRSNSRTVISTGSEIIGDAGTNKNRLFTLKQKLGVQEMGQDDEVEKYFKQNDKMNFLEKIRMASQPSDINFVDNSVPEEETK